LACIFFFFQAEDGIRDFHVTGVQTCALPIYERNHCGTPLRGPREAGGHAAEHRAAPAPARQSADLLRHSVPLSGTGLLRDADPRSEERRVGKECSCGWSPDEYEIRLRLARLR